MRPAFPGAGPGTKPIEATKGNENAKPRNGSGGGGGGGGDQTDIDPIIRGLLARLPTAGSVWPENERKLWLGILADSFKLIHKDTPAAVEHAPTAKDPAAITDDDIAAIGT